MSRSDQGSSTGADGATGVVPPPVPPPLPPSTSLAAPIHWLAMLCQTAFMKKPWLASPRGLLWNMSPPHTYLFEGPPPGLTVGVTAACTTPVATGTICARYRMPVPAVMFPSTQYSIRHGADTQLPSVMRGCSA